MRCSIISNRLYAFSGACGDLVLVQHVRHMLNVFASCLCAGHFYVLELNRGTDLNTLQLHTCAGDCWMNERPCTKTPMRLLSQKL
jgi:hypothetical protein